MSQSEVIARSYSPLIFSGIPVGSSCSVSGIVLKNSWNREIRIRKPLLKCLYHFFSAVPLPLQAVPGADTRSGNTLSPF